MPAAAPAPCETFVADVTIPDRKVLQPATTATKTWQLRNCGSRDWSGVHAERVPGTAGPATFPIPATAPGAVGTLTMSLTVPSAPGAYRSTYRLVNADGAASTGTLWGDFVVPSPTAPGHDCEAFVADVTIPDGTALRPGITATKAWRLRNCGTTDWSGLTAVRVDGAFGPDRFAVPPTVPGAVRDVSTTLTAPTTAGHYRATYRLQAADGYYADNSFWVDINVNAPAVNRQAVTSYDQMRPGAPYHGYFASSFQPFAAASNTLTFLSATVGSGGAAPGSAVPGWTLTLRLCTNPSCTQILAEAHPTIVNYGETAADIGDVAVTPGATYYLVWYQPPQVNGATWVTYWWAGGPTIAASDQMQGAARGYNR